MEKINFAEIDGALGPKKILEYEKNKHLFTKVAFDTFRMNSSPFNSYWTLQKADDGKEYLIATYEDDAEIKSESNWDANEDKDAKNITISYKNIPIIRLSGSKFGFDKNSVGIFKRAAVKKLNKDSSFAKKLLKIVPEEKRNNIIRVFPELATK